MAEGGVRNSSGGSARLEWDGGAGGGAGGFCRESDLMFELISFWLHRLVLTLYSGSVRAYEPTV